MQWKFLKHIPAVMMGQVFTQLDQEITKNELYAALKRMKQEAAPGLDGLTVPFYLAFWHKVGDLVFQAAVYSYQQGRLPPSQCRGILRLLPKKGKNPLEVRNWRPITLLNVDYKMISKLLAIRLADILPSLIGTDQRGFIKGRYIGDNIYEIYSILSQAEQEQEDGVLLQLDIEKAFDSVSWQYLEQVLNNFNFPTSFMSWVSTLYREKEIRIINNGFTSWVIHPSNGLAQGDGLSPLLFTLVIETLALTIRANNDIVGYKFKDSHKKLAMLADDMILSLKAQQTSIQAVFDTLQEFARISNLMVNTEKSLAFPIGPHQDVPHKACNIETVFLESGYTMEVLKTYTCGHDGSGFLHNLIKKLPKMNCMQPLKE